MKKLYGKVSYIRKNQLNKVYLQNLCVLSFFLTIYECFLNSLLILNVRLRFKIFHRNLVVRRGVVKRHWKSSLSSSCRCNTRTRYTTGISAISRSRITNDSGVVSASCDSRLFVALARSYRARGYRVTRIKRRPGT